MGLGSKVDREGDDLDRAILALRATRPDEVLSEDAKSSILNEIKRLDSKRERPRVHIPLFVPMMRLAVGAAVPIAVVSLLVASALISHPALTPTGSGADRPRVEASKSGNEVVFVIRNGHRTHTISRSTAVDGGAGGKVFTTTTGRFSDRLDSDAGIVYYRID